MKPLSLRARITWLTICVQIVVLLPLGVISYRHELRDMDDILDIRLAQAGHTLAALVRNYYPSRASVDNPDHDQTGAVRHALSTRNFEPESGFQVFDPSGRLLIATANLLSLPAPPRSDSTFADIQYGGKAWRTFSFVGPSGRLIRIAERAESRRKIARDLRLEHLFPLLILLPVLAVLAGWAVQRGLRPLFALTGQLAQRTPGSRQPLALSDAPPEIQPLLATLNQQFQRLEDALEREHRFNADVAHELRTPLAATLIRLETTDFAGHPDNAQENLNKARESLMRLARRVEQILTLASLEAGAARQERQPLDLVDLVTEVIEDLAPLIAEKNVSLSLKADVCELLVQGHGAALFALARNLIENALRYVARGGRVAVTLAPQAGRAVLEVSDDGPGIPSDQRGMVFDRFQRAGQASAPGHGLGMNIVRRAAQLHGASVELLDSPFGRGLRVRISLPLAAS